MSMSMPTSKPYLLALLLLLPLRRWLLQRHLVLRSTAALAVY
jgi:hypothetical protein